MGSWIILSNSVSTVRATPTLLQPPPPPLSLSFLSSVQQSELQNACDSQKRVIKLLVCSKQEKQLLCASHVRFGHGQRELPKGLQIPYKIVGAAALATTIIGTCSENFVAK